MIAESKWKWFGLPGHFICSQWCRFHLCTQVGQYLISTVGQLWLERSSREIHASIYDPKWFEENRHLKGDAFDYAYMSKFGFETVGAGRLFETMVFQIEGKCTDKKCNCGQPSIIPSEIDALPSNRVDEATKNHMELCTKWARKQ